MIDFTKTEWHDITEDTPYPNRWIWVCDGHKYQKIKSMWLQFANKWECYAEIEKEDLP